MHDPFAISVNPAYQLGGLGAGMNNGSNANSAVPPPQHQFGGHAGHHQSRLQAQYSSPPDAAQAVQKTSVQAPPRPEAQFQRMVQPQPQLSSDHYTSPGYDELNRGNSVTLLTTHVILKDEVCPPSNVASQ